MKKVLSFVFTLIMIAISLCSVITMAIRPIASLFAETDGFDCKAYCLMDNATGEILKEKNSLEHLEIASMVKLMTALITMEKIENKELDLLSSMVVSEYAAGQEGSQAFLDAHSTYTVEELLKSVIIASANDSSVVLAESIGGNEYNFVSLMNKRAQELGLKDTLYANSTGLPAINQYSCARDVATLLREVNKHDIYKNYSTIWMDKLIHKSGRETELVNTNRLIKYYPNCDCGKTGFTDEAGYCLSASAKRDNMRLIAVSMGCKTASDRFTITSNLLNYGFANYTNKVLFKADELIENTQKVKGFKENILAYPEKEVSVLSKKLDDTSCNTKIEFNKNLEDTIQKDSKIGTIYVIKSGIVIEEVALLSAKDYKKQGFSYYVATIFKRFA